MGKRFTGNPGKPEKESKPAAQPGRGRVMVSAGGGTAMVRVEQHPKLKQYRAMIDQVPETRDELVQELRGKVTEGRYQVSSEQIAEAMLSDLGGSAGREAQL